MTSPLSIQFMWPLVNWCHPPGTEFENLQTMRCTHTTSLAAVWNQMNSHQCGPGPSSNWITRCFSAKPYSRRCFPHLLSALCMKHGTRLTGSVGPPSRFEVRGWRADAEPSDLRLGRAHRKRNHPFHLAVIPLASHGSRRPRCKRRGN